MSLSIIPRLIISTYVIIVICLQSQYYEKNVSLHVKEELKVVILHGLLSKGVLSLPVENPGLETETPIVVSTNGARVNVAPQVGGS